MDRFSRILVLVLSISLITGYLFPIWSIDLEAPQYPEGLGMKICIDKLTGDINTINGLNHYIGMKKIEESSIPELKFMPYMLGVIIALGLIVALANKKWLLHVWVLLFASLGIAGGVDFYLWEYDYGHNLDPRAAIKIPGMYYQPPLFGSKELLNFTAHSYPDTGGWVIIVAGILAVITMVYSIFKNRLTGVVNQNSMSNSQGLSKQLIILIFATIFIVSCKAKPEPISYGEDMCHHCKMKIMDERFGAEIVTKQAKVFKFDAIECMVNYYHEIEPEKKEKVLMMLIADASKKGTLVEAEKAFYLHSDNFPSPMSSNISGYGSLPEVHKFYQEYKGEIITWVEVRKRILTPEAGDYIHKQASIK